MVRATVGALILVGAVLAGRLFAMCTGEVCVAEARAVLARPLALRLVTSRQSDLVDWVEVACSKLAMVAHVTTATFARRFRRGRLLVAHTAPKAVVCTRTQVASHAAPSFLALATTACPTSSMARALQTVATLHTCRFVTGFAHPRDLTLERRFVGPRACALIVVTHAVATAYGARLPTGARGNFARLAGIAVQARALSRPAHPHVVAVHFAADRVAGFAAPWCLAVAQTLQAVPSTIAVLRAKTLAAVRPSEQGGTLAAARFAVACAVACAVVRAHPLLAQFAKVFRLADTFVLGIITLPMATAAARTFGGR